MKGKIKNAQVEYDSNDDILKIKLEEREEPLISLTPIEDYVRLGVSSVCGALCSVEILNPKLIVDNILPSLDNFEYKDDEDTIYIHFTEDDGTNPWCDNAYIGDEFTMVSLNKNSFGNLTGIEIINISKILNQYY
jgi:uncharacterized protein YuzE